MAGLNLSVATRIANFSRARPAWQRLLGAAAVTVLVVLARMALNPALGHQHNRHLIFLPTIMLVAWLGGFAPGIVSALLSTAALAVLWTDHAHGWAQPHAELLLFLVIGVAICWLLESLHAARTRADAASKAHEQVLAIVAHDLRNPLSTIRMTSDRIRSVHGDDGDMRRRLQTIDRAAARMEHLIRDLVDSTRIEQSGLTLAIHREPAGPIVQEAVDLITPLAQERGIAVEVSNEADRAMIDCDRGRVLQVLGNLLGNALKFTPEGGRITVRSGAEPGGVIFQVEDNGRGIAPGDLPHIFERHWKTDPQGTGLGLYIARSIVQAHGGSMGVHSELGQGARFFFTIPAI
jgi:signal transduction histidine kinase